MCSLQVPQQFFLDIEYDQFFTIFIGQINELILLIPVRNQSVQG